MKRPISSLRDSSITAFLVGLCVAVFVGVQYFEHNSTESVLATPEQPTPAPTPSPHPTPTTEHAPAEEPSMPDETEISPLLGGTYLEVIDSCGPNFEGECVNVRSGPGTEYGVVTTLRTGIVLKVSETTVVDGRTWHRVVFDEWIRYPERVAASWYVAGDFVRIFSQTGTQELTAVTQTHESDKHIIVDRSEQMLYAYDGEELFMQQSVSTGLELTPTPRGTFTVFRMMPSRYMQGPLPGISDKYYDLPGVPWNLYFTHQGGAIHGTYWHDNFGQEWSSGCVNLPPEKAEELYAWAELGMKVTVRD